MSTDSTPSVPAPRRPAAKKTAPAAKKTAAAKKTTVPPQKKAAAPAKKTAAAPAAKRTPARPGVPAARRAPARKTAQAAPQATVAPAQPTTAPAPAKKTTAPAKKTSAAKKTKKKVTSAARLTGKTQRALAWSRKHPFLAIFGVFIFTGIVGWRHIVRPVAKKAGRAGRAGYQAVARQVTDRRAARRITQASAPHKRSCQCHGRNVIEVRDHLGQYQGSLSCPG